MGRKVSTHALQDLLLAKLCTCTHPRVNVHSQWHPKERELPHPACLRYKLCAERCNLSCLCCLLQVSMHYGASRQLSSCVLPADVNFSPRH